MNMEDLYEILECDPSSSQEEIRRMYMKLALQYHPDKTSASDSSLFLRLQFAWETLGDPDTRKEYDIRWKERCLVQDFPIHEEVLFSDFDFNVTDRVYTYPCKCGDDFSVNETDAKFHYDIICCKSCSLTIKVFYDSFECDLDVKQSL